MRNSNKIKIIVIALMGLMLSSCDDSGGNGCAKKPPIAPIGSPTPDPEPPTTPKTEDPDPEPPTTPKTEDPDPEPPTTPKTEDPDPEPPTTPKTEDPDPEPPTNPKTEDPTPTPTPDPAPEPTPTPAPEPEPEHGELIEVKTIRATGFLYKQPGEPIKLMTLGVFTCRYGIEIDFFIGRMLVGNSTCEKNFSWTSMFVKDNGDEGLKQAIILMQFIMTLTDPFEDSEGRYNYVKFTNYYVFSKTSNTDSIYTTSDLLALAERISQRRTWGKWSNGAKLTSCHMAYSFLIFLSLHRTEERAAFYTNKTFFPLPEGICVE